VLLDRLGRRYSTRPSQLLGVEGGWDGLAIDFLCAQAGKDQGAQAIGAVAAQAAAAGAPIPLPIPVVSLTEL
jgi:hypothetical protein